MDPTSAVRTDILPAIATVIVPGAAASGAYIWLGLSYFPEIASFLSQREVLSTVLLILLLIAVGFVIESVGSYVEVHVIDAMRGDRTTMVRTWWQYLRSVWADEPVGQRYLRRLLVSFKFELNMFTATVFAAPGVVWLWYRADASLVFLCGLFLGLVVLGGVFLRFAKDTADVLANVRKELTKGVIKR